MTDHSGAPCPGQQSIANHDILPPLPKIANDRVRVNVSELTSGIVETYQNYGWQLRRVLLRPEIRAELEQETLLLGTAEIVDSTVDGLWFSRNSHNNREAWELRLLAENPFALFETFEQDETEEQREEMRQEMEARLREHVNKEVVKSNK